MQEGHLTTVTIAVSLNEALQASQDGLKNNQQLNQLLTYMNVHDTIKFSAGFMSQLTEDQVPVVHQLFEKNGVYYVLTSEEVSTFEPQNNGYTDVHNQLFHVDDNVSASNTPEGAAKLVLQTLIDGDKRSELNLKVQMNDAYTNIFNQVFSAVENNPKPIDKAIQIIKNKEGNLYGFEHFVATQLKGQLEAQKGGAGSVMLVNQHGGMATVGGQDSRSMVLMGLVDNGTLSVIQHKMEDAIKASFWSSDKLKTASTDRQSIVLNQNKKMKEIYDQKIENIKQKLNEGWEGLSKQALKEEIGKLLEDLRQISDELSDLDGAGSQNLATQITTLEEQIGTLKGNLAEKQTELDGITSTRDSKSEYLTEITNRFKAFEIYGENLETNSQIEANKQRILEMQNELDGLDSESSIAAIISKYGIDSRGIDNPEKTIILALKLCTEGPFVITNSTVNGFVFKQQITHYYGSGGARNQVAAPTLQKDFNQNLFNGKGYGKTVNGHEFFVLNIRKYLMETSNYIIPVMYKQM